MKIDFCFCLPRGDEHVGLAYRFLSTYVSFPPHVEHNMILLTDPGYEEQAVELFRMLPNVRAVSTPDAGKDLSRYFAWAEQTDADVMLCMGGSTYCRRAGWGLKAISAFQRLGEVNLYGACGHTGQGPVQPHIRTTGFWCSPKVMRKYPLRPQNHAERYQVEHGVGCLSSWFTNQGHKALVVSFAGEWDLAHANDDPNGYARGTQFNLLLGDRLTCPPYQAYP